MQKRQSMCLNYFKRGHNSMASSIVDFGSIRLASGPLPWSHDTSNNFSVHGQAVFE